jgi:hypothetical protein
MKGKRWLLTCMVAVMVLSSGCCRWCRRWCSDCDDPCRQPAVGYAAPAPYCYPQGAPAFCPPVNYCQPANVCPTPVGFHPAASVPAVSTWNQPANCQCP